MTEYFADNSKDVRVRFAPSPTGYLHIGGVRTALFNWLYARHNRGKFILRIEDTDRLRSTEESINMITDGLSWCGIDWDEGPYLQTERKDIYIQAIDRLLEEGKAYKCYCSPETLEEMRKKQKAMGMKPLYDGRCRDLGKDSNTTSSYVVRFMTPREGTVTVSDIIRGNISIDNSQLDDLVILRSDRTPTYNFASVVDDAYMNITHVIRGDDHISNTPRQIHIYNGLGYNVPKFAHLPMILGKDKTRLSKRHGAASVLEYRERGYLPEAIVNYLARLGWSHGDQEIFSIEELIKYFDLDHINNAPAVFDDEKLTWLNCHYIKNSSASYLSENLERHIKYVDSQKKSENFSCEYIKKAVPLFKDRSKTLIDMAQGMEFYLQDDIHYDEKGRKKFFTHESGDILKELYTRIKEDEAFDDSSIKEIFNTIMVKKDIKLIKIAQPVRLALTGKTVSPGIFEVILLLGKERVLKRLKDSIDFIFNQGMIKVA